MSEHSIALLGMPGRPSVAIGRRPAILGRDVVADIAIDHPMVSRHHAMVWFDGGVLNARDLGPSVGSFIDAAQLDAGLCRVVPPGAALTLARVLELRWTVGRPGDAPACPGHQLRLGWDAHEGWRDEVRLAAPLVRAAPRQPAPPEPPRDTLASLPAFMLPAASLPNLTAADQLLLRLVVGLDGDGAVFKTTVGEQRTSIAGTSRVALLYLLARQHVAWVANEAESPWLDDETLAIGLWGRAGLERGPRALNTIIARIRGQLRHAGLSPDVLEKRVGAARIGPACHEVVVRER